ncbi:MAG: hypothetical protein WCA38_21375 [Candidatus Acidiferrales bacterium]
MARGTLVSQLRASELRATTGQQTVLTPTVTSGDSQTKPNSPPILVGTSYPHCTLFDQQGTVETNYELEDDMAEREACYREVAKRSDHS